MRTATEARRPVRRLKFQDLAVPAALAGSGTLDRLVNTAKDYARQALGENTNAAYKADWAHFSSWCRRRGAEPIGAAPCPDPQTDRSLHC